MSNSSCFVKVSVHENSKQVFIACPACGTTRSLPAEQLRSKKGKKWGVKAKCQKCQSEFKVGFDFRNYYRREIKLPAILIVNGNQKPIMTTNLSMSGLGFTISDPSDLSKGQTCTLQLTLDNPQKTYLNKRIVIESIRATDVGASFFDKDFYEPDLGFYLMR